MNNRIDVFSASLAEGELALIISPVNRRYFTSFLSSDGYLVVTNSLSELYLDSRYIEMAQKQQAAGDIPESVVIRPAGEFEKVKEKIAGGGFGTVYYEDRRLFCSELEDLKKKFPGANLVPLGKRIEDLRMVKTEDEKEKLIKAQRISEKAFEHILGFISPDKTEIEIALELEFFMRSHGAEGVSFDTICVSGKKSSMPHGRPADVKLTKNSFLTMDFGCIFEGYCSDMTRTVCVGKASDEMKKVYATVLEAQLAGIAAVKAGVTGASVDKAARDVITAAGHGSEFGHSTGHGVGLEIHEAPAFSPKADYPIQAGCVLSVEPGIYIPDKFGVRIEDVVIVEENGCLDIAEAPKQLIEL